MLDELSTKSQSDYVQELQIKYACKEIVTRIYFNPELCCKMLEFVKLNLASVPSIVVNNFVYNDINKTIHITFDSNSKRKKDIDWTFLSSFIIYTAFREFYKSIVSNERDFYTLYQIDPIRAAIFKEVVNTNVDSICNSAFSCFSILYTAVSESETTVQINLI